MSSAHSKAPAHDSQGPILRALLESSEAPPPQKFIYQEHKGNDAQLSHKDRIVQSLCETRGCLYDISLRAEDGRLFPAHRCILTLYSPYFAGLLRGAMAHTGVCQPMDISFCSASVLEQVLDYMYTGWIEINSGNCVPLLHTADFMMFDSLKDRIAEHMEQYITVENCADFLRAAEEYNCPLLHTYALAHLRFSLEGFCEKSQRVLQLGFHELDKILRHLRSCLQLWQPTTSGQTGQQAASEMKSLSIQRPTFQSAGPSKNANRNGDGGSSKISIGYNSRYPMLRKEAIDSIQVLISRWMDYGKQRRSGYARYLTAVQHELEEIKRLVKNREERELGSSIHVDMQVEKEEMRKTLTNAFTA